MLDSHYNHSVIYMHTFISFSCNISQRPYTGHLLFIRTNAIAVCILKVILHDFLY